MTKPRVPVVVARYRMRVQFVLWRPSANTGGQFRIGVNLIDGYDYYALVDVTQYTAGGAHFCEFVIEPSAYSVKPLVPFIQNLGMGGAACWISNLRIFEDTLTPGVGITSSPGAITLAAKDDGQFIRDPISVAIATDANVPLRPGFACTIFNSGPGTITITPAGGVTLRLSPSGSTGTRTLSAYGTCVLVRMASDSWMCRGDLT